MIFRYLIAAFLIIFLSSCEKNTEKDNPTILKLYGDALEDIGYSIAKTSDGYFIGGQLTEVARLSENGTSRIETESSVKKMAIIKTDFNGQLLWKKTFGDATSLGSKVIALPDGSAVCTGYVLNPVTKLKDILVVKISSDGTDFIEKNL